MQPALVQVMNRVPPHALSVFLFLDHRAKMDTKVGCSQQEVSRATGYSVGRVREALGWLESPTTQDATLSVVPVIAPFLTITGSGKGRTITLLEPMTDMQRKVRFTFEDTDDRRIAVLEAELRRLATADNQRSRLSIYLQGEPQQAVAEIEGDLGRRLTIEEGYMLGAIVALYGVPRLKQAWRRHGPTLDRPIQALYAMFMKERFGQQFEAPEVKEARYEPLVRDTTVL